MKYALVKNNVIEAIREDLDEAGVIAIGSQYQAIVDVTNDAMQPEVGWGLDGSTFTPPIGTAGSVKITKLAFRNRFTANEKAALYTASASSQGIALKIYIDDLAVASYVDLKRPDTIAAINLLAQIGIVASERVAQILSTTVSEEERYRQ